MYGKNLGLTGLSENTQLLPYRTFQYTYYTYWLWYNNYSITQVCTGWKFYCFDLKFQPHRSSLPRENVLQYPIIDLAVTRQFIPLPSKQTGNWTLERNLKYPHTYTGKFVLILFCLSRRVHFVERYYFIIRLVFFSGFSTSEIYSVMVFSFIPYLFLYGYSFQRNSRTQPH